MDKLMQAIRYAFRQPGFSLVVILTLALGIGANTAIFSFVNALLLRPFPFKDPEQLVQIHSVRGGQLGMISGRELLDLREQASTLESVAGHSTSAGGYNFSGEGRPEEWKAILTTGNLFEVLGVPLQVGAKWPEITDRQRDFHVLLTNGVWRRCFGGRPDILGSKITLDHAEGYVIDGVTGPTIDYPRGVEVYRSIGGFTSYDRRVRRNLVAVARIKRPYSLPQLQAELDALSRRLAEQFPDTNAGLSFRAVPFRTLYSGEAKPYLLVMLSTVGFALLIGCANVVNLLLSRGLGRAREMGVRMALGAGRADLIGQMLAETAVLSLAAGVLGIGLALWWVRLFRALVGPELPTWMTINADGHVLLFTLVISLIAALLSGLAPALQLSRPVVLEDLKDGGRGSSSGIGARRLRDAMIVVEIAVAMVLFSGAALLAQSFAGLVGQDKGFRPESLATFRVALGWKRYIDQPKMAGYYQRALEELSRVPGFNEVALASLPPVTRLEGEPATVQAEGQSEDEVRRNPYVTRQSVSENYFQLMHIPLRAGRQFSQIDTPESEPVAIVSARLAKLLWPGQDPLGKHLRDDPATTRSPAPFRKVVGVVGDVRDDLGHEPGLDYYLPYRQETNGNLYILVRTTLGMREFTSMSERVMWSIDREQSIFDFKSYEQRILDSLWQLRLSRTLLILFSGMALALAATGTYSVISYSVGQRRRELGIRVALGATPNRIQTLVLTYGLNLACRGLLLGIASAIVLGRLMRSMLPQMAGSDLFAILSSSVSLLAATLFACLLPARRASTIDPIVSLRDE